MATLRVTEKSFNVDSGSWKLEIEFDGLRYDAELQNPFSDDEETDLEWYFEQYIRFPVVDTFKAKTIVEKLGRYGQNLFYQILPDDAVDSPRTHYYKKSSKLSPSELTIEIVGGSQLQRIHWELLRDPTIPGESGLLALSNEIIRRPLALANLPDMHSIPSSSRLDERVRRASPSSNINIVMVVARPSGVNDAGLRIISRPLFDILEGLRQSEKIPVRLDIVRPGTFESLKHQLALAYHEGYSYQVVHFDLHGTVENHDGERK
jgi:hypothetical protein